MIELDLFYTAAGLLPPKNWEAKRLYDFRKEVFSKIPDFLSGKEIFTADFSRRSGKTTTILIEALHAEWYGYNTTIIYKNAVEQYYAKHQYNTYKNKILAIYGPPISAGVVNMISNSKVISTYGMNSDHKTVWDRE